MKFEQYKTKQEWRDALLPRLRGTDPAAAAAAGRIVCESLLGMKEMECASHLAFYSGLAYEIRLDSLIDVALQLGKAIYLPRFNAASRNYEMANVSDREADLVPGRLGIMEPHPKAPVVADNIRQQQLLWLVPGVGFDRRGRRLGRGAGHYDRMLARVTGLKVGVAYDWQLVNRLPSGPHDVSVDRVVTDAGLSTCR